MQHIGHHHLSLLLRTGCSIARWFINAGDLHESGRKAGPPGGQQGEAAEGRWRLNNGPGYW